MAEAGVRAGASGGSPPGQADSAVAQVSTLRSLHRGHPGKWACTPTAHLRFLQLELGHHKGSPTTGAPAALQTSFRTNIHTPLSTHPGICDLEFTQDILGHVVLSHRVNDKVLVASRALCGPVLVALLLWTEGPAPWSGGERVGRGAPGFRGFGDRMPQVVIMGSEAMLTGPGEEGHDREGVAGVLTLPISRSLVSMTMMVELCSHSMRQKSSVLSARGPCVAM